MLQPPLFDRRPLPQAPRVHSVNPNIFVCSFVLYQESATRLNVGDISDSNDHIAIGEQDGVLSCCEHRSAPLRILGSKLRELVFIAETGSL